MDETDFKILHILKKNARENFVNVAKLLGIAEGTVRNRIKRLVKDGVIKRFTIEYETPVEGLVIVKGGLKNIRVLANKLRIFSDNIFEISGEYDVAAIIKAGSIDELNIKIDRIRKLRGVKDTNTAIKLH